MDEQGDASPDHEQLQPKIKRQLNRPNPKGLVSSEPTQQEQEQEQEQRQASPADSEPIVGIGTSFTSHIDAPKEERSRESGLITFLGSHDQPKEEEIITYLGEKPAEGTPEAAEIETLIHEVVLADQIPDSLLPFIVQPKKKKKKIKAAPIEALKALEEIQVHDVPPPGFRNLLVDLDWGYTPEFSILQ